ncbi:MAG TPA: helix-turn-helix domain-containing protein [Patescibacteria group bacterium]|nr:helix-turn-helix domain-containing protein [Patescibacteria group bacterium]
MQPIGKILQAARKEKNLTLEEVSERTKIRSKYLEAIEENSWKILPGIAYIRGFIKTFSDTVGLDSQKMLILFRREYAEDVKQEVLPKGMMNEPLPSSNFFLTFRRFISKLGI